MLSSSSAAISGDRDYASYHHVIRGEEYPAQVVNGQSVSGIGDLFGYFDPFVGNATPNANHLGTVTSGAPNGLSFLQGIFPNPIPAPNPITVPVPTPTFPTITTEPNAPAGMGVGVIPGTPAGGGSGSIGDTFAGLFKFDVNWRFMAGLVFITLTVYAVEQKAPEYVWTYIGILLLGYVLAKTAFGPQLNAILGG
jgi:hypothetical protein